MSERSIGGKRMTQAENNTSIDLIGAIAVGLGIPLYNWLFVLPPSARITSEFIVFVFTSIGAYILAALMFSLWRGRLRVKIGWILIVVTGSLISAAAHSLLRKEDPDPVFRDSTLLPLEIIFFTFIGLIVMVVVQSIGFVVRTIRNRDSTLAR